MKARFLLTVVAALAVIGVIDWALAGFSPPANLPPTCTSGNPGCDPPIHAGAASQAKQGALTVGSSFAPLFTLDVPTGSGFFGNGLAVVGDVLFGNGLGVALLPGQLPTAAVDINGQIKIRGGAPAQGRLLTSDSTGLASWGRGLSTLPAVPEGPGASVMYLRSTTAQTPPVCPAADGFLEAAYNTVSEGLGNNNVRTCYNPDSFCQVMELLAITAETPAACPAGFTQAQYNTRYLGGTINNGRVCYKCYGYTNVGGEGGAL